MTLALIEALRPTAREAGAHAWAPHSGFRVGAAVRADDGQVFAGCNVESDSYGLTQCAERNALAAAVAGGVVPGRIAALLLYVAGDRPLPPCGACRQWIVEHLDEAGIVVACCDGDDHLAWRRDELLPGAFRMD